MDLAVDPDYEYPGYLRVRIQQLLHNFHVTWRWRAEELSMEDLWKAAQKEGNYARFVP